MTDISNITPEMAQAELARRQSANYSSITPEMAQAELARRNSSQQQSFADRFLPTPQPWAQNFDQGLQHAFMVPNTQGSGAAYTAGDITGNTAQFIAGGEALDAARGAAEAIPYAGKLAKMLGGEGASGMARRAIGTAGYGAATNPNDITKGAGEGAALSIAFDAIPGIGGFAGKAINTLRPQKHAEQMLNSLGGGKSLEENAQSLAKDIAGSFKNVSGEVKEQYKPIFDSYAQKSIYEKSNPGMSAYQSLDADAFSGYDRNLNKLHEKFLRNPVLQNAHDMQSQLGSSIRKLESSDAKGNLSVADRSKMQGYQDARNAVKNDINTFLTRKDPALAAQYESATQNFAERVAPYLEHPKIAPIAKGEVTNPKNISNIFKNPEPELQQIINDVGAGASHKILYAELGKTKGNLTPEKLANAIGNLDKQGLSSYVTPEFEKQADALTNKINMRKGAGTLASAITGGVAGHSFGIPYGETLGATAGLAISPIVNALLRKTPNNSATAQQIAKALSAGYRPVSKAVIANTANGS